MELWIKKQQEQQARADAFAAVQACVEFGSSVECSEPYEAASAFWSEVEGQLAFLLT